MKRSLFFSAALLSFSGSFGQPSGSFDVSDAFGTIVSPAQISKVVPSRSRQNATSNAGFFELTFKTGSGFEGTDAVSEARRNVAIQVFSDISALIQPAADPYTNASNAGKPLVKIAFEPWTIVTAPPAGERAVGSTYYIQPPGENGGFVDGEIWKTINGGYDSYRNMTLLGYSQLYFHGYIAVDFSLSFHTDLKSLNTNASAYDLYTVVLHSAYHALGFNSLINSSGQSTIGMQKYSRFDSYLLTNLSVPIIDNPSCYGTTYSGNSLTPPPPCTNNLQFGFTSPQPVYSPATFTPQVSLCHFDASCSALNFLMASSLPGGSPGNIRKPTVAEVKALCDLGYRTTGTYGTQKLISDPSANNIYSFDPSYGPCGNRVGGVNDFFVGGDSLTPYTVALGQQLIISDFLNNDDSDGSVPALSECVEVFPAFAGTATSTNTTITYQAPATYPPNFGNQVFLRYIPVSAGGKKGNITYITIHLTSPAPACTDTTCNLVCLGNFEDITDPNALSISNVILSGSVSSGTPDIYLNNCRYGQNCSDPAATSGLGCTNPFDNPTASKGDRYIGMFTGEPVFFSLRENMMPGKTYQFMYKARTTSPSCSPVLKAYISNAAPCPYPYSVKLQGTSPCRNYDFTPVAISSEVIDNTGGWKLFSISYKVPANAAIGKYLILHLEENNGSSGSYVLIDEVAIYQTPILVNAGADFYPCSDHNATFTAKPCVPGTYSFSWKEGQNVIGTSQTINVNPSVTTSYVVTATNLDYGLTGTDTVVVLIDQFLDLKMSIAPTCLGDSTGSVRIDSIPNGKAPFTYYWGTGPATNDTIFTGLKKGEYYIKVIDSVKCAGTVLVKIDNYPVPEIGYKYLKPVTCFNGSDGRLKLQITGGDEPYSYQWDFNPSVKGDSLVGLKVGNYTVSVTDTHGCVTKQTFEVETLPLTKLEMSAEEVTCPDGVDGQALVSASNSKGPYKYIWSNYPPSKSTSATGLVAGTYKVTVTDANTCKTVGTVEVKEMSPTPPCCGMSVSKQEIMAYPNPSRGLFNFCFNSELRSHLALRISSFNVYDLKGNLVYHDQRNVRIVEDRIDLSGLKPGLYILEVSTDEKQVRRKLFIY
jgi:hypothetical protein